MSSSRRLYTLSWWSLALGVVIQSSFLFTNGTPTQTYISIAALGCAVLFQTAARYGWRWAIGMMSGVAAIGFGAEALGVATGFPFGDYSYSGALGWSVAGVSMIVPLAWAMFGYTAWRVACYLLTGRRWTWAGQIVLGAWALTAWDVFLDSQMVAAGNWGWAHPEPSLPGTPGIPLTNYAGWLLVSLVIMLFLQWLTRRAPEPKANLGDEPLYVIYLWTFVGSLVANLTFWQRPSVAVAGAVVMGVIVLPLVWKWLRARSLAQAG